MKKSIASKEYKVFLKLLVDYREKAGLTQVQLAERLSETQSFVSKIERGERRVDVIELFELCQALEVSTDDFLAALQRAIMGGH